MLTKQLRSFSILKVLLVKSLAAISVAVMLLSPAEALAAGKPSAGQTPQGGPVVYASITTNCRQGPNTVYLVIGYLNAGQSAPAVGRTSDNSWWEIQNPNGNGSLCWVWGGSTQVQGDINSLAAVAPPAAYFSPSYTAPTYSMPYNGGYFYAPRYAPFFFAPRRNFRFRILRGRVPFRFRFGDGDGDADDRRIR